VESEGNSAEGRLKFEGGCVGDDGISDGLSKVNRKGKKPIFFNLD